jgi:hypothetical protein
VGSVIGCFRGLIGSGDEFDEGAPDPLIMAPNGITTSPHPW